MTEETPVAPDPVVRTALQLLPVPEHQGTFWDDLDRALAAEAPPVRRRLVPLHSADPHDARADDTDVRTVPVVDLEPDPSLAVVPLALRHRSNGALVVAAVAAAVLVVVAGATLVRQRSADLDTADVAGPAQPTTLQGSTTTAAMTSDPDPSDDVAATSSEVVLRWVGALAEGDLDAAWDILGQESKQQWGTKDAFVQERSGLAEGYGAWSATTPEHVLVTRVPSSGEGTLVVVTLVGELQQEGTTARRADAFPVRLVGDEARLEMYSFAGELEVVVPEPVTSDGVGPVVEGDELVVVVPSDAPAPILRLDDGDTVVCGDGSGTELRPLEEAPGQRCSYTPEGGIEAGERVLTVVLMAPDGSSISARSVLFEAV